MSHTPGPWMTEEEEFIDSTGHLYVWIAKAENGEPNGRICQAYSNCLADEDSCRANARLIAAAPDLLSALERLEHSYGLLATGKPVRDMAETLGEVRHALKKAKGES